MPVDPTAISGATTTNLTSLGSAFGLSDDEYNTVVKTGDKATPHMVPRQIPKMMEVSLPDGSTAMRPSNQMQNAQEDFLDANGNPQSRDVMQQQGLDWAPVTSTIGAEVQKYSDLAFSSNPADRDKFEALQKRLYAAGFLKGKPTKGVPDDVTIAGLTDALKEAVRGKVILDEVLEKAAKDKKATQNSHAYKLTSPTDVKAAVLAAAPQLIGHGVDQATIDKITSGFNSLEATGQKAAFDAQDANAANIDGTDTVNYDAPNAANYVNEQLRAADPAAAQSQQLGHFFAQFKNMLGGSSAAPSLGGAQ